MTSKQMKNILNFSTIKILILLSIIIILILLYLKLNNKELFTSVNGVDTYFKKYFAIQDLYKSIQTKLDVKGNSIDELGDDIQTVLEGKIVSPKTTLPLIQGTSNTNAFSVSTTTTRGTITKEYSNPFSFILKYK